MFLAAARRRCGVVIRSYSHFLPAKVMGVLLVTSNKIRQLLCVSYIGRVRPEEFPRNREDLTVQLEELSAGFRLLADFSQLESMGLDCEPELGRTMELIGKAGVELVVRVFPDPSKDIGMNILTVFHYPHRPRVVTCDNLVDAAMALGL
ncbi:MAG TPA: hypothetical protein VMJ12_14645 [Candidatus Acidoferrales bacterium]|nr:hypothetical protein [Candidatus Acidoferrales bacterium]